MEHFESLIPTELHGVIKYQYFPLSYIYSASYTISKHYLHFRFSLVDIDSISANEITRNKTVKLFQHILLPIQQCIMTTTTSGHYLDLNFWRR